MNEENDSKFPPICSDFDQLWDKFVEGLRRGFGESSKAPLPKDVEELLNNLEGQVDED